MSILFCPFKVALDAGRARGAQPLRIGCDSKAGNDGSKFFVGSICHVAVYRRALTPHEVFTHRTIAMLNLTVEANRLYGLAAKHFKDALVATPRDSQVRVASACCCSPRAADFWTETWRKSDCNTWISFLLVGPSGFCTSSVQPISIRRHRIRR